MKQKYALYFMIFLLMFAATFFFAYSALKSQAVFLELGLPSEVENTLVMTLSAVGMIFMLYEIIILEIKK